MSLKNKNRLPNDTLTRPTKGFKCLSILLDYQSDQVWNFCLCSLFPCLNPSTSQDLTIQEYQQCKLPAWFQRTGRYELWSHHLPCSSASQVIVWKDSGASCIPTFPQTLHQKLGVGLSDTLTLPEIYWSHHVHKTSSLTASRQRGWWARKKQCHPHHDPGTKEKSSIVTRFQKIIPSPHFSWRS